MLIGYSGPDNTTLSTACYNKNPDKALAAIFRGIETLTISEESKTNIVKKALSVDPSALDRACALGSVDSINEIFNAVERFIPKEDQEKFVMKLLRSKNRQGFYPASNASNLRDKKSSVDTTLALMQNARRFISEENAQEILDQKMAISSVKGNLEACRSSLRGDIEYQDKLSSIYNPAHTRTFRSEATVDYDTKKRSSYLDRDERRGEDDAELAKHTTMKHRKTLEEFDSDHEDDYRASVRVTSHKSLSDKAASRTQE